MQKQFVTYEIAKKLREKGFDEKCLAIIDQTEFLHIKGTKGRGISAAMCYDEIPCPLWKQAIDWLLEKHFILVCQEASSHNIGAWASFKFTSLGAEPTPIIRRQSTINTAIEETLKHIRDGL